MTVETALYNYLSGFAGLVALVSTRIYPLILPQTPTLPAVVYQQVSGPRIHAMGDDPGITSPRYQFSCWDDDHAGAAAVAQQIRLAFENYSGLMGGAGGVTVYHASVENMSSEYYDEAKLYRVLVEVIIYHGE